MTPQILLPGFDRMRPVIDLEEVLPGDETSELNPDNPGADRA